MASTTTTEVDLSAFPIVRLDQIQYLDNDTLNKAKDELLELIETSDGTNTKWVGYLQKQYDAMHREELNRQAELRIQQLLSGTINPLETDYNSILSQSAQIGTKRPPRQPAEVPENNKGNDISQDCRDSNSWMQQNMATRSKNTHQNKPLISVSSQSSSKSSGKRHVSPVLSSKETVVVTDPTPTNDITTNRASSSTNRPSVALLDLTTDNLEQATRENSRQQSRECGNSAYDIKKDPSDHSVSTNRSGGATTRSNKSKRSNPEDDAPSKKSLDVVYKNFGSVFVVAATEKRKRFYPAKKNTETPEEVKRREKLERRKQAMERLMKRKEEREAQQAKLKEKRRKEQAEKKKTQTASSNHPSDDSDSESVSGGDDGPEIEIDPKLVEIVKQTHAEVPLLAQATIDKNLPDVSNDALQGLPKPPPKNGTEPLTKNAATRSSNASSTTTASMHNEKTKRKDGNNNEAIAQVSRLAVASSFSASKKVATQQLEKKTVSNKAPNLPAKISTSRIQKSTTVDSRLKEHSNEPGEDIPEPVVEDIGATHEEFQSKNMAALSIIRKLKLAKTQVTVEDSVTASSGEGKHVEIDNLDPPMQGDEGFTSDVIVDRDDTKFQDSVHHDMGTYSGDDGDSNDMTNMAIGNELTTEDTLVQGDFLEDAGTSNIRVEDALQIRDIAALDITSHPEESFIPSNRDLPMEGDDHSFGNDGMVLFEEKSGAYVFNYGPDNLPGLMAWKLDVTSEGFPQWSVDLDKYRKTPTELFNLMDSGGETGAAHNIFGYRAMNRRFMPLGLVLLSRACGDILLGKTMVSSSEGFKAMWLECVRTFDELYQDDDEEDDRNGLNQLFKTVSVCGNGYGICKKIEALLKHVFTSPHDQTVVSRLQTDATPVSSNSGSRRSSAAYIDAPPDAVSLKYLVSNDEDASKRHRPVSSSLLRSIGNSRPHSSRVNNGIISQSIHDITQKSDNSNSELIDEDVVMSTMRNDFDQHEKYLKAQSGDENLSKVQPTSTLVKLKSKGREPLLQSVDGVDSISSKRSQTKLVDFYPHFSMIFPVTYHSPGSTKDDGSYARSLVECMQVQAKVYEEWVEVMRDYSTVFCMNNVDESTSSSTTSLASKVRVNSRQRGSSADTKSVGKDEDEYIDAQDSEPEDKRSGLEKSADVYKGGNRTLHYRVKSSRQEVSNIVTDVFQKYHRHWESLPTGLGLGLSWNLLWTWSKPHINKNHLLIWQRVNHFEDSKQLTRKDLLKKNIQRYLDMGSKTALEFEIMPPTFVLPHEYTQFVTCFTQYEQLKRDSSTTHNYWILKPVGLSRGRGISLVRDLSDLTYSQSSVIQKYIERPLCLASYKFDLRIYVVVTSFKPLEAFIYRDGFARVSTQQYSLDPNDVNNKFIHLTNSSIQKHNQQDIKADNPLHTNMQESYGREGSDDNDSCVGGSKISLLGENGLWKLLQRFSAVGGKDPIDTENLWKNICLLIVKSLVMVDDKMVYQPCCFELFGYDILIDENYRPWLIEVNASPSLARENSLDHRVKNHMMKDMIDLLDVPPFDRAALVRVIKKRLGNMAKTSRQQAMAATVGAAGSGPGGRMSTDQELEQDLRDILGPDFIPRRYGELPKKMGNYERLCPETINFQQAMKLKKKIIKSD